MNTLYIHVFLTSAVVGGDTPRQLYPREKSPRYPLNRRLSGRPEPVWATWRGEILAPSGAQTPTLRLSNL
jgi:hypothetical protein